ncbi:MAG: hypothetical protein Q7T61_04020 [Caulobacter sp.]|nr:hypothetical protein [Caulobacter sp.]
MAGDYIDITLKDSAGGEAHEGFVVGLTGGFVMLESFEAWTGDGVRIIPLEHIEEVVREQIHKDRQAILVWNGATPTEAYDWLNLSGFRALFASVLAVDATVCLHDEDEVEVGKVLAVFDDRVRLKLIDGGGAWVDEPLDYPFADIVMVETGDQYSSVLRRYAERAEALKP